MKLYVLLLLCCVWLLLRVDCSLPEVKQATPPQQDQQTKGGVASGSNVIRSAMANNVTRLPGLCRRLKRRRVTVLCNLEKFCWLGRSQGRGLKNRFGQVCRCPRGSRCPHVFVHSH